MSTVLVTSALPYVNNIPHLGNIIGSTLSADIYARFLRMMGNDVLYLCGSDEYGTTTEIKARKEGLSCEGICSKYHQIHKDIYNWFNIKFDVFGRTSTETQTEITHEIFFELYKNGHIESHEIDQMQCTKCDLFLADRYLQGYCYSEKCKGLQHIANGDQCDTCGSLLDPFLFSEYWCSICHEKPNKIKTKHLYLRLDDFREQLKDYFLKNNKSVKLSTNAFNITKSFLDHKLESRCITRNLKWGTPVPEMKDFKKYLNDRGIVDFDFNNCINLDDFKEKVFYVWFDAPIGYLSILKHARPDDWRKYLEGEIVQWFGKDNTLFHTIIFPATLMGSNKYPLVTGISCTEYLLYEGQKFSKSNNIGIFGDNVISISNKLNIDADYWRYYLVHIRPETKDSNFSWNEFMMIVKSELAFKIGNFINRCISMSYKYFKSNDENYIEFKYNFELDDFTKINDIVLNYIQNFNNFKLRDALYCITSLSEFGNQFIQRYEIWNICREDLKLGSNLMGCMNYLVCILIKLMEPIMPNKAETLSKNFNANIDLKNILYTGSVKVTNTNYVIPFKLISEINSLDI